MIDPYEIYQILFYVSSNHILKASLLERSCEIISNEYDF